MQIDQKLSKTESQKTQLLENLNFRIRTLKRENNELKTKISKHQESLNLFKDHGSAQNKVMISNIK